MKKRILVIILVIAAITVLVPALAIRMTAPTVASAATTEVTGDVIETITVLPPSPINLGQMLLAYNKGGPSSSSGRLATNYEFGCTLNVESNRADGKMSNGTNTLSDYLRVNTGTLGVLPSTPPIPNPPGPPTPPSGVAVTTTPAQCMYFDAPNGEPIGLEVWQSVSPTDPVATGYSIILTYTATANPPPE